MDVALLIGILCTWLAIVALVASIDVGSAYYKDVKDYKAKVKSYEEHKKNWSFTTISAPDMPDESDEEADEAVRRMVSRYREMKREELGGVFTIGHRPAQKAHGVHRRIKTS